MIKLPILFALLLASQSQDRTRVNAELSQPSVSVGATVALAITVETPSSADIDIRIPHLPNLLQIVGSQESSQLHYSIPGGRRRVVTRELVLQAAAPGTVNIPAIEISVGGNIHRTRPLVLSVTGSATPNPSVSSSEAWLRVTMSPETVYVGQQTTLIAEAGFSEEVRLRLTRPPIFDVPAPTGFWVQELPGGIRSTLREVDGRVVEVQSKRVAYFPLTAGRYALKPPRAIIDVRQGFLYAPVTREVRSASPRVTVLPLPEANKPLNFHGAVGTYDMEASVEPLTVAAGEPVQIRVQIRGRGNVKALGAPTLPQIVGAEVFAPTEESRTDFDGDVVTGTKTFTYVIIPENEGALNVPAIKFSYFDPAARAYRIANADPVQIRVLPAGATADTTAQSGSLRALRAQPDSSRLAWVASRGFALAQLLSLLAIVALVVVRRRTPRIDRSADYFARVRAAASRPDADVYRELDRIVRDALREPGVATHTRARAEVMLQRIEAARFAPEPPSAAERGVIQRDVEELIATMFAERAAHHHSVVVIALLALTQTPFDAGARAYEAGDFRGATNAFQQHVAADPTDANGWFNLGNAYFRSGEKGRAFWAWATTLRLDPRNSDVVHNLRAAGNVEALRVRPPLAVRSEEWLLAAALLWWNAAAIIILALARRRTVPRWVVTPVALAVLFGSIGMVGGRPPRYAVALNDPTALQAEPTIRSTLMRNVRAGAVLRIEEERGEWLRVQTVDKREAWVARDDVAEIDIAKETSE
jgi:tetratricopeptide (TPR) repeat protein